MPTTVTSPNMGIVVPVNLTDPSPDWGARLQTALQSTIDVHDHSSGKGVLITPAGLNINADLPFGSNNATGLRTVRLASLGANPALGSDIGCLSNVNGNAVWNNGSGTSIQLTNGAVMNNTAVGWTTHAGLVTGNFTITNASVEVQFLVNTGAAVTVNLPASSSQPNGRLVIIVDQSGTLTTHNISVVPNGTDTINGANATFTFSTPNFGKLTLVTDAAGHWMAN